MNRRLRQLCRATPLTIAASCAILVNAMDVSLAGTATAEPPLPQAPIDRLLEDLAPELVRAAQAAIAEGTPPLQAVQSAVVPYEFDGGAVVVRTDPRWFQTLAPSGPDSPLLELRRWPGDTVVTFYPVAYPQAENGDDSPPLPPGKFEGPIELSPGILQWSGYAESPSGPRPAVWIERRWKPEWPALGALILPGDAGRGPDAVASLVVEAITVVYAAEIREPLWKSREGYSRGLALPLPVAGSPPDAKTERDAPWQVVAAKDFTMGLPPGFSARRVDGGVPAPVPVSGHQLWFRGYFTDIQGVAVQVGDGIRAGYVSSVAAPGQAWRKGQLPPLASPTATPIRGERFPLLQERTGASYARAERWREPGFSGEWLLFRLDFGDKGFEIGLPVLSGRQSESLFWIPASWRDLSEAPAPPPLDPAERFGIRFERLTASGRRDRPWSEGFLEAPGLRAEFPKGYWPSTSLRSADGFPVRVVDREGNVLGSIFRVDSRTVEGFVSGEGGWEAVEKAAAYRAERAYRRDGELLLIASEGHAFLLARQPEEVSSDQGILWQRLMETAMLLKPGR